MHQLYARPGHLTADQTRQALGISAGALRNLVLRKQLKRSGGSERYPEFAAADVAAIAAKRAARTAA
ncbi:hypothetical protein ACIRU8_10345 [Streptomyces sp. NPDC101175]|uniref:hypothetical protein n=1 Tax=Streptomyces sp. NPDC101175 TaxID=3366123 RepID=UPI0038369A97